MDADARALRARYKIVTLVMCACAHETRAPSQRALGSSYTPGADHRHLGFSTAVVAAYTRCSPRDYDRLCAFGRDMERMVEKIVLSLKRVGTAYGPRVPLPLVVALAFHSPL